MNDGESLYTCVAFVIDERLIIANFISAIPQPMQILHLKVLVQALVEFEKKLV